jgi:lipopolysaccharide biosynthesis glycosyltransferase
VKQAISVAMCADKNVEVGLHVTLYSLLKNSDRLVKINLVHKGYTNRDLERLKKH